MKIGKLENFNNLSEIVRNFSKIVHLSEILSEICPKS